MFGSVSSRKSSNTRESSNGRTAGFDPVNLGSNPSSRMKACQGNLAGLFSLWYDGPMPIVVQWPSISQQVVPVWVVLHLSGMSKSMRHAKQHVQRREAFLDGNVVDLRTMVNLGEDHTYELVTRHGRDSRLIRVVERGYHPGRSPRVNHPRQEFRRG